ncbi:beta-ketoacyl synthase chain length factor [Salinispora pacifica]|uniref:beta-ketoacyl synthase chain length factor n=1 Tax=Salinispora pacifica TaxID=351187 RepID=UPI00037A328B|nr:beta-ketoacyl synthase chain length factor [Salinispora pacifica]
METRTTTATRLGQGILSGACLAPWGESASGLPGAAATELPPLAGFVVSRFSPLVAEVARRCLAGHDVAGPRTAVLLGSIAADATTADTAARDLACGDVHNPLLFFQSVPSSVLGALAKEYNITGPMTCLSAREDLPRHLLETAAVLLADGQVERVLVIAVELTPQARARQVFAELAGDGSTVRAPRGDFAVALLLTRGVRQPTADGGPAELGYLASLAALCPTTAEEAI